MTTPTIKFTTPDVLPNGVDTDEKDFDDPTWMTWRFFTDAVVVLGEECFMCDPATRDRLRLLPAVRIPPERLCDTALEALVLAFKEEREYHRRYLTLLDRLEEKLTEHLDGFGSSDDGETQK